MNPLVAIERRKIGDVDQLTVNARDLWRFVESRREFVNWIKARIQDYGFVEGQDYLIHKFMNQVPYQQGVLDNPVKNPMGGRPTHDYYLTVDMAKELAMVERNDKGREVRRYFIDCERQAKEAHAARQVTNEAALSARMQRYLQAMPLPHLDRYQNGVINRRAAALARQMMEVNRDYLLHELAGLTNTGDNSHHTVDDHTLDYLIYTTDVEGAYAFGRARSLERLRAHMAVARQLLG